MSLAETRLVIIIFYESTHSLDVRKHSNVDDGIAKTRKEHGDVGNKERYNSFLSLFSTFQTNQSFSFRSLEVCVEQTHLIQLVLLLQLE